MARKGLYDIFVSYGEGFNRYSTELTDRAAVEKKNHLYATDNDIVGIYIEKRKEK